MKNQLLPLTPEQQVEQIRQFDSVFSDMSVFAVKQAAQACGMTADEALRYASSFAERMRNTTPSIAARVDAYDLHR